MLPHGNMLAVFVEKTSVCTASHCFSTSLQASRLASVVIEKLNLDNVEYV